MNGIIWIAGILLLGFLAICIRSVIENRTLAVTRYQVSSPKIPKEFEGCRLAVLADLHNACFGDDNELLVQKIREEQPDYILLVGDMIVGKPEQSTEVPVCLIETLAKDFPIYYARGNHELRAACYPETYGDMWETYRKRLDGTVTWLQNDYVELTKGTERIFLYGLDLPPRYYKRFRHVSMEKDDMTKWLGVPEAGGYRILLAHNPDYFPEYAAWGADLVLSGHLHGGMIRLPWLGGVVSPMVWFFPKYDKGKYQQRDSIMLLSGGLGNHTFKFRVNNLPEILIVTLSSSDGSENM